ncbi:Hypp6991 [Branchiostoma lanceolatum]|uniref:Activated RNA polymerase II transcriptional coactivator p15 n=1 Tax=Branchiostoma lanceolatum TaxID=7740 RepID=A0A8J9YW76_BRALA|nr:Hypp6991 [Branchiostoma lanceolatum]
MEDGITHQQKQKVVKKKSGPKISRGKKKPYIREQQQQQEQLMQQQQQQLNLDATLDLEELMMLHGSQVEESQPPDLGDLLMPQSTLTRQIGMERQSVPPVSLTGMERQAVPATLGSGSGVAPLPVPGFNVGVTPHPPPPTPTGGFMTALGVNSQEIRFPLGDDVYLSVGSFNNREVISVHKLYTTEKEPNNPKPGSWGLTLTGNQWKKLKEAPVASTVVEWAHATDNSQSFQPRKFHLGNLRYLLVEDVKGQVAVKLWEFNRPFNNIVRTSKGVAMTLSQWEVLNARKSSVDHVLGAMSKGKQPLDLEVVEGIPI